MDTERAPRSDETTETHWRTMYATERRKARILGATTVAASLLAVGTGAWGLSNAGSATTVPTGGPGASQVGPGGTGQVGPPGMPDGTMPGSNGTGTRGT